MLIAKPAAGLKAQWLNHAGFRADPNLLLHGGEWNNTADAISEISVVASAGNFAAGTSILLEGLST
jgi:hypothetical protein